MTDNTPAGLTNNLIDLLQARFVIPTEAILENPIHFLKSGNVSYQKNLVFRPSLHIKLDGRAFKCTIPLQLVIGSSPNLTDILADINRNVEFYRLASHFGLPENTAYDAKTYTKLLGDMTDGTDAESKTLSPDYTLELAITASTSSYIARKGTGQDMGWFCAHAPGVDCKSPGKLELKTALKVLKGVIEAGCHIIDTQTPVCTITCDMSNTPVKKEHLIFWFNIMASKMWLPPPAIDNIPEMTQEDRAVFDDVFKNDIAQESAQ